MTILGPAESFKMMNRPDPTRPGRNALWRLISQKVWKIGTWNFNTIFIQLSNLCYQNLELISLLVWKLWAFPQGSNFVNFQQFFHHNFRLKWNFWILMVPSERSCWDLSEYISFYIRKYFFIYKNKFLGEKLNFLVFLCSFFPITSKVYWFYKFW